MKYIPFSVIAAAQQNDIEAADIILRHFEGYMMSKSLNSCIDKYGNMKSIVDDDLYYQAKKALLSAIFTFRFREPPDDFII